MKTTSKLPIRTNGTAILTDLKCENVSIGTLKHPRLAPKPTSDKALQSLMRAMHRVGRQLLPVLVDDQNTIIAGLEILEALRELGGTEISVVRLSHLTAAEAKAVMLLLAKVPEQSKWDETSVAAILEEISIEDPDALDITGFDTSEIDIALGNADFGDDRRGALFEPEEDELQRALDNIEAPIVRLGDAFQLNEHRIVCGNSLASDVYDALLSGKTADLVATDPPYNVPIAGNVSGLGKTEHADFAMGVGEMSFDQFTQFLRTILVLALSVVRSGALMYFFMDRRHLEELFRAVRETELRLVDVAIWNKLTGGMGGLYRSQHEPCIVVQAGDGPLQNNVQLGKYGRYRTNVWDCRGYGSFGKGRKEALATHPTVKPWSLLAEIILDSTSRGAQVLDPFLGSGSTIIAAEKTNRRCFGIELEPKYIEVAIARWEALTGKKAIHIPTGKTIGELRRERSAPPLGPSATSNSDGDLRHE